MVGQRPCWGMKKFLTLCGLAGFFLASTTTQAKDLQFLDAKFSSLLCTSWNKTKLPTILGRQGSAWIDSNDSPGKQVMVLNRSDCTGWPKVALTVTADASGNAVCSASGKPKKDDPYQWKMEPSSAQWADFADGFGVMDMPGLMGGFVGSYGTAMNNMGAFEKFFAVAGYLAVVHNVSWQCDGIDMEDLTEEISSIDHDDLMETLAGTDLLK